MTLISSFKSASLALWLPNLRATIAHFVTAPRIWRQRQSLLRLDASQLDDIGLSRDEAIAEAARPIWDAPATWRS